MLVQNWIISVEILFQIKFIISIIKEKRQRIIKCDLIYIITFVFIRSCFKWSNECAKIMKRLTYTKKIFLINSFIWMAYLNIYNCLATDVWCFDWHSKMKQVLIIVFCRVALQVRFKHLNFVLTEKVKYCLCFHIRCFHQLSAIQECQYCYLCIICAIWNLLDHQSIQPGNLILLHPVI